MRTTRLAIAVLAGTTLAGCHHRQPEPEATMYPATSTTTTTTTTSSTSTMTSDSAGSGPTYSNAGTSTSARGGERRGGNGGMRAERREVHAGIAALERARRELEHAGHEFGGRRADALKAVDGALHELRLVSGQEAREARTGSETAQERRAEAHELHVALTDLERARADMERAPHNFSGRRKEALEAVDTAIREIRLAAEHEK